MVIPTTPATPVAWQADRQDAASDRRKTREEWPVGTYLVLASLPGAVPCARLHARAVLAEWRLNRLRDTELLVSELMTNAITAARSIRGRPPVRLDLRTDGIRVLVLVHDANPQPPVRQDMRPDAETGRGLILVQELATSWGWMPAPPGKTVWCTVS